MSIYRSGVSLFALAVTCLALSAPAQAAIVINEVESDGAADFIELMNTGGAPVDVSGYILKDSNNANIDTLPGGTIIPAGGFFAWDTTFGLASADSARVFLPDGFTLLDTYSWTTHAFATYGRCPDGTGAFIFNLAVTKGAANACPTVVVPAWPGSPTVTTVDQAGVLGGDVSGLDYEGTGTATPGVLWDVDNSNSRMDRLVWNGTQWVRDTTNGWSAGKVLRYPGGTDPLDSEGVTLTDAGSAGGVFVSSESNLAVANTSRNSVLRFDVSGAATTLTATLEWNLTADLPVVGFNSGAESVEWVPDTYLVAAGFKDQLTNLPYNPANYPGHGTGLFFVGLEANGNVYVYALHQTNGTFNRLATFASGFPTFGALHFDPDERHLWVVCDNNCEGRSRLFQVNSSGNFAAVAEYARPTGMPNVNNEGFTFARDSECVGGFKPVYWADDDNTGNNALRAGTIRCTRLANDVLFDFGSSGLYQRLNNNAWLKLHPASPVFIASGDLDNTDKDEAIASFSTGLWARYNNTTWVKLHSAIPARFATGNVDGTAGDDLIADFGSSGVWIRYNNTGWTQLTPATSQEIETGDLDGNGKDEVILDLGASGLWIRVNNASWTKLHPSSPTHIAVGDVDGNNQDDAIIDFGSGSGVWIRYNNTSWTQLHPTTSQVLATGDLDGSGKDDVLIDFGATGLYVRFNNATWVKLHNASPVNIATADLDSNGKDDAVIDFGGSTRLYIRYNNATWTKLSTLATQQIAGGGFD